MLLKVVPLSNVADNGGIVTTYGLLDTAAVSSMITSQLAEKLKLQCGQKNFFFTSCGFLIPFNRANAQRVFHGFHIAL